jgi:hypothetical protein
VSRSFTGSGRRWRFAALELLLVGLLASSAWQTAAAAPRNYLMGLWGIGEQDTVADPTRKYSDLDWFELTKPQPLRKSIMKIDGYYLNLVAFPQMLDDANLDWSKIAAVWIDEPYLTEIGPVANPLCSSNAAVVLTESRVAAAAQAVRNRSSTTRVWVNFSKNEVKWMRDKGCNLNRSYIDVVSIDVYTHPFFDTEGAEPLYYYLKTHAPTNYQQRGLVPLVGSKFGSDPVSATTAAGWLPAYFEYAAYENLTCNRPLGPTGATGLFDGCPVWAVLGWPGVSYTIVEHGFVGFFDLSSAPIKDAWHAQRAVIRSDQMPDIFSAIHVALE